MREAISRYREGRGRSVQKEHSASVSHFMSHGVLAPAFDPSCNIYLHTVRSPTFTSAAAFLITIRARLPLTTAQFQACSTPTYSFLSRKLGTICTKQVCGRHFHEGRSTHRSALHDVVAAPTYQFSHCELNRLYYLNANNVCTAAFHSFLCSLHVFILKTGELF